MFLRVRVGERDTFKNFVLEYTLLLLSVVVETSSRGGETRSIDRYFYVSDRSKGLFGNKKKQKKFGDAPPPPPPPRQKHRAAAGFDYTPSKRKRISSSSSSSSHFCKRAHASLTSPHFTYIYI